MSTLNRLLATVVDLLLAPFNGMSPLVGLAVVSLLVAIAMLLVFKATSDQKRIEATKRRLHACIYEIRLFNDDLRAILRAQTELLRHNLTYLRLSLVPMVWTLPWLILVMAQLQFLYGYSGLSVGDRTLVTVTLKDGWGRSLPPEPVSGKPPLRLEAAPGLHIETPGVWVPSRNEITWRVAAEQTGDLELQVRLGDQSYSKSVRVSGDGDRLVRISPERRAAGFWNQLLYPAEDPLPSQAPLRSIVLRYPDRELSVFGFGLHWIVVFFVLSLVLAFALKDRFGVTI